MKHFFVTQMILVANFLFHLNTILVTGQVALSRRWLRGKFSDQKTEMNLMKIAGSGNGIPSYLIGNGNDNVNGNSDGDGLAPQIIPLRQPPSKRMNGKMLKRLLGQNFEDGLMDEGSEILVTATDADNDGGNADESWNNVHEKPKRIENLNFVPNPNKYNNSVSWIWKGEGKPDLKHCRAIFVEAMDSWSKNNNYCNCVQ